MKLKFKHFINFYSKIIKKHDRMIKTGIEKTEDIPNVIPANGHDICNYIARWGLANHQIQAVMQLDGKLDFDKLSRAVRLSVDAEPVLGCQFVESDPPYWKRWDNIDDVGFCSIEETDDPGTAVMRFLESPMDMDNDPMVKVKLIRSDSYDTLGVKVNHVCCDGAGAKEYIQLLSEIYTRIDREDEAFVPKPSIRSHKDHYKLISPLGTNELKDAWNPRPLTLKTMWNFHWKNCRSGITRFVVSRLPLGQLDQMKTYAKARGATINDLILAAVYRAMFDFCKPLEGIPMDIPVTIDLRRYLPGQKAEAIRNLSGAIIIRVSRKKHESFEETLSRVMSATRKIKNGLPGMQCAIWAECIDKMSFLRFRDFYKALSQNIEIMSQNPYCVLDKCGLVLSNFGLVSGALMKFGENTVTDAYIIPPVVRAPGILLVASTYNGILTFSVGYYEPSIRHTHMERLLDKIKNELAFMGTDKPLSNVLYSNDFNGICDSIQDDK